MDAGSVVELRRLLEAIRNVAELRRLVRRVWPELRLEDHLPGDPIGVVGLREHVFDLFMRHGVPPSEFRRAMEELEERRGAEVLWSGRLTASEELSPRLFLSPEFEIVPFVGRQDELGWLESWPTGPGRMWIRRIEGAGGTGKTRLCIAWLRRLRARAQGASRRVKAGFLWRCPDEEEIRALEEEDEVYLVVDYAELRLWLSKLLCRLAQSASPCRFHVLLLSRRGGAWWSSLAANLPSVANATPAREAVRELGPHLPPEARDAEARRVSALYAARLGLPAPSVRLDPKDSRLDRPLFLHLTALNAVLDLPSGEMDPVGALLEHELRRVAEVFGASSLDDVRREALMLAVRALLSAITLRGGLDDGHELDTLLALLPALPRDETRVCLSRLLQVPGGTRWLSPIEPDVLGDALISQLLKELPTLTVHFDVLLTGLSPEQAVVALTRLGHVAERLPKDAVDDLTRRIRDWLTSNPDFLLPALHAALANGRTSISSPVALALTDAALAVGDEKIAVSMDGLIPPETVMLRHLAVWVASKLWQRGSQDPEERVRLRLRLARRLAATGEVDEARGLVFDSLHALRRLHGPTSDAIQSLIMAAEIELGLAFKAAQRHGEAIAASQRAIARYARIQRPTAAHVLQLATAQNNEGISHIYLRQHRLAVRAFRRAILLYALGRDPPSEMVIADVAAASLNLASALRGLGRLVRALEAADRAARDFRALMSERRDAYAADCAMAISNVGLLQLGLQQFPEAAASFREAVELYTRLHAAAPREFAPLLAGARYCLLAASLCSMRMRR